MVFPEERELPEAGEPLPGTPGPEATPTPEAAAAGDEKIRALEAQLDQLRQLKAGEQTERLRELQTESAELLERQKEQEQFAANAEQTTAPAAPVEAPGSTSTSAAAAVEKLSAATLLVADPQAAVAALVQLATASASGFERAVHLVREVAPQPGGAWILDEFHKRMVKGVAPEART